MPEGGGAAYLRDTTVYAILKQKPYNFSTNTLKAYLSAQPSSLSAFMISKTHIGAQEPRERQLNAEVCGSESAIFSFLPQSSERYLENGSSSQRHFTTKLMLITARSFTVSVAINSPWSIKLFSALPSCCPLRRTPFCYRCTHAHM